MYKTLRSESLRRVLPRIIACAVLAAVLLGLCGGGLIRLAAGPKALDSVNTEDLKGSYVSFDASEVIVAFATLSNSGGGSSKTLETYYLLPVGDGQYMAVMDAKERNGNILERAMEQSHEYYLGDLETLTRLGSLRGTVGDLDEDMLSYMADCIDNYGLPGYEEGRDSQRLLVPYQINLDRVGFLSVRAAGILGLCALAFLLLLAAQLIIVLTGCYQRKVRALIGNEDDAGFEDTKQIERVRVGKYVWYSKGPGSRAIKTEDLIWGYAMPEPMVVSKYRWPVALYDGDQNMTRINFMEQKNCQEFLEAIAAQGHPFHLGYTSQLSELFQTDFAKFVRQAEQEAKARKAAKEGDQS